MRLLALILVVAGSWPAIARAPETIDQLKARVESAPPKERVGLALRVAELETNAADKLYADGKSDEARAAIQDVVTYTEKAGDAATQSGKKLKDAEIMVRKIANKLADMKRSVTFEDQPPIAEAIDRLERIRTQLLAKMFDLGKGSP